MRARVDARSTLRGANAETAKPHVSRDFGSATGIVPGSPGASPERQRWAESGRDRRAGEAIAITLLVLEIGVPSSSEADLLTVVVDQWPSYLAHLVSFATIDAVLTGPASSSEGVVESSGPFLDERIQGATDARHGGLPGNLSRQPAHHWFTETMAHGPEPSDPPGSRQGRAPSPPAAATSRPVCGRARKARAPPEPIHLRTVRDRTSRTKATKGRGRWRDRAAPYPRRARPFRLR